MLILTRRINERIIINEDVTIEILAIKGNQVSLGIAAPRNVSVHREEIYNRINYDKKFQQEQEKQEKVS